MASKEKGNVRMDALTDGVFAIVATLLVLDIKLPDIPDKHTQAQLLASLKAVLPSFIAFAFSFLSIIVYWINHDHIGSWIREYSPKAKYLNLHMLFWICLIPFPTRFISEYPDEKVAVMTYGVEMFMVALSAWLLFRFLAFQSDLLYESISQKSRRSYARKILGGIVIYALCIVGSIISTTVPIALYIAMPLLFLVLPKAELLENA